MLEKYGGLYKPSFSNQNIFDSQEHKSGWSKLLGILKSDPTNENTLTTIKKLKGQKKVIELVQNHKLKELMLQNDNILKCFVYDNLVSYPNKDMSKRVCKVNQHPSKRDTKEMILNLINNKDFILKLKNEEFDKIKPMQEAMKQREIELKNINNTANPKSKSEDSCEIVNDLKNLVKQISKRAKMEKRAINKIISQGNNIHAFSGIKSKKIILSDAMSNTIICKSKRIEEKKNEMETFTNLARIQIEKNKELHRNKSNYDSDDSSTDQDEVESVISK